MRICHVSPHLPPDQAANALLPAQLGRWSHDAGIPVSFVTQPPSQGGAASDDLPGPVRRIHVHAASGLARLLRIDTVRRARTIVAALNEVAHEADLLHLHSNGLIVEVAAEWARRRKNPFTRAYERAAVVTFYSEALRARAGELGLGRSGGRVIYPPVSPAFAPVDEATRTRWRTELGLPEPHVFLNVKRLHPLADQSVLIEAFARLARGRTDLRLVICGTGPLGAELRRQVAALGVASLVTFTGLVANEVVARYAACADRFVLPSRLEALPTVAVEALASGTPVISADHPGGRELHAIFGDDVEVVPRQDVDRLAEALGAALQDPRRTRPRTLALVRERFSPEAVWQAYAEVYREALGAGGGPGPQHR
jgi:glycosyltransferase involved in cell wall biosynthesis